MRILLLAFILVAASAQAQKPGRPERFARTITAMDLKKQLAIIAGPQMEGRETATEGQRKAAAYIEAQFKSIGLQPGANGSYQQPFTLYQDSLTSAALEVAGQAFEWDVDFSTEIWNQPVAATLRFSEVVVAGLQAYDTLKNRDLAGRLVFLVVAIGTQATEADYAKQYALILSKGPAAILVWSPGFPLRKTASLKSRLVVNRFRKDIPPQEFAISENVAKALLKDDLSQARNNPAFAKTYNAAVLLDVKKVTLEQQSSNVLGVLPGTGLPGEYLVITAHCDHLGKRDGVIYYGADDDGSGTVGVIELAQAFAQAKAAGQGPRRTIVFMAVSGEEKGLLGSEYYAGHPLFPLEKTTANLNMDMIGRSDSSRKGDTTNYVYVVGDDKLSSELRPISEAANNRYTKLELDYKFNDPDDRHFIYYRSDHYNFAKNGVPIIFYYDGMLGADYHKPTDTPDKINYALLVRRAQLVFYTAWEMANRPQLLRRDKPLPELRR